MIEGADPVAWLALAGWAVAAVLGAAALTLRRRLELAAHAEHELRGPLAALALGIEQVRRGRAGPDVAGALDAQLDRSRAGLADLAAAREGRVEGKARSPVLLDRLVDQAFAGWELVAAAAGRALHLDWRAGRVSVAADKGRVAQVLGNLISNALEHGHGDVELRGWRVGDAVRIEVTDRAHGPERTPAATSGGMGVVLGRGTPPPLGAARGRGLTIVGRAAEELGGRLEVGSGERGTTAALELPVVER